MTATKLERVHNGQLMDSRHLNQYADAIEEMRREADRPTGTPALLAMAAVAAASTTRVSRRWLLGLGRKK